MAAPGSGSQRVPHATVRMSFHERSTAATVHPLTSYLLRLMDLKASNLCLSADVATARELLSVADRCGPSIVVLKTHHDLVSGWDFNPQNGTGAKLQALARKHGFLIFEDRKLGDIGNTVQQQYTGGSARIIDWAHIVNAHLLPGPTIVDALAEAAAKWRKRINYEVRTSVTVGTPTADSFADPHTHHAGSSSVSSIQNGVIGAGVTAGGDENVRDGSRGFSARLEPPASSHHFFGGSGGVGGADPAAAAAAAGRKGSIVSVTTVTQSFEPVDSPRASKSMAEGDEVLFPGIEEVPAGERGLLLLAQMSTKGNLATPEYTAACVDAARRHKNFVMGFVSQESLNSEPDDAFIHMTPGCQLPPDDGNQDENGGDEEVNGDGKGQQYQTPRKLITLCGTDIVIVGRGILNAGDWESEADRYRRKAWKAYLERLH